MRFAIACFRPSIAAFFKDLNSQAGVLYSAVEPQSYRFDARRTSGARCFSSLVLMYLFGSHACCSDGQPPSHRTSSKAAHMHSNLYLPDIIVRHFSPWRLSRGAMKTPCCVCSLHHIRDDNEQNVFPIHGNSD
jgi:hypothetical protein